MRRDRRAVVISVVGIVVAIGVMAGVGYRMFDSLSNGISFSRRDRHVSVERVERPTGEVTYSADTALGEFDEVAIIGSWTVEFRQGSRVDVEYSASERASDRVEVYTQQGRLFLSLPPSAELMNPGLTATVVVPNLSRIDVDGGASISIDGFDIERLHLEIDGAASVKARESVIEELVLDTDGATNLDFSASQVVNARVSLDGATSLSIDMAGGELTGVLRGIGEVTYSGDVERQTINIDGLGRVRRQ